ncbi:TetR/AcrR family transcriptional regulator [Cryobacterium breve]|uniref:TetR/AcrR family transcriptional regulator n=1 Tax=Cryobacterium breve TaxID=1259258 RepID=UPI0032B231E1
MNMHYCDLHDDRCQCSAKISLDEASHASQNHTSSALLSAAWTLFTERGYVATTVAQIAQAAGTSVDTLYEAVGRKPVLLRQVVESAISGSDETIPAERRDYVQRIRETPDAATKFQIYAAAIAAMSPRTAPIFLALRDAARTEPGLRRPPRRNIDPTRHQHASVRSRLAPDRGSSPRTIG